MKRVTVNVRERMLKDTIKRYKENVKKHNPFTNIPKIIKELKELNKTMQNAKDEDDLNKMKKEAEIQMGRIGFFLTVLKSCNTLSYFIGSDRVKQHGYPSY